MIFLRRTQTNTSIYQSGDNDYVIEGWLGRWSSYFTPGGPASRLNKYPFKMFRSAEYICDYDKIVNNSPDGE